MNRASCRRSGASRTCTRRNAGTGSDLPLQFEWVDRLDLDRVPHEDERRLSDQHLTWWRGGLQPGCHVDRVTGCEPFFGPGHHLARHDTDPALQAEFGKASRISAADRTARNASSSCTVGTPNTAMTASPMNFSTLPPCRSTIDSHPVEVTGEQRSEPLGVDGFAECGGARQVAEQDGNRLALLPAWLLVGCPTARVAEPVSVRVLCSARPARCHGSSLGGHETARSGPLDASGALYEG